MTICSACLCRGCDFALSESKQRTGERPLGPAQQELVAKTTEEQDSSNKHSMFVNSSEQDGYAVLMEEALCRSAENLPDQDPSRDPG